MTDVEREYRQRLTDRQAALAARERTHAAYAWARIAVFLGGVVLYFVAGPGRSEWVLAPAAAFVVLAIAHARLLNARDRAKSAVAFYQRGLERVTHQWIGKGRDGLDVLATALPGGLESHLYAVDLDLFGRGSLFEMLATTRTHAGEEMLARWLLAPASAEVARARQDAVRELGPLLDLRERVAVMGDEVRVSVHAGLLRRWSTTPITLRGTAVRFALVVLTACTTSAVMWWLTTGQGIIPLAVLTAIQLAAAGWYKPRVSAVIKAVEEPAHDLALLAELVATIERQPFQSECLRALQARLAASGRQPSAEIRALSRLVAMLQSRNNVMFAIPAGIMMWATHWAFAIEAWRLRAGVRIPDWLDVVGEFEALLALASFSAEHPRNVFPVFETSPAGRALLEAVDLAHPALGPAAVANSIRLDGSGREPAGYDHPSVFIVSGSNMSGKSTWLRSIGTNVVLAAMGAPVRARSMRLSPLELGASIRVVDSLTDGRSRFMAEITRLKAIVDAATRSPGGLLFLLDEILSGTNSHDRRAGAEALVTSLVGSGAIGLTTTHDLALGEIADRLPGRATNVHFEDQFSEGALAFDYKLRPGIVRTSNALALMRSIGIDV
jgi:hypothetical protein